MSMDESLRMLSAFVAARIAEQDDREFVERHGGTVLEVAQRERSRDAWARKLLAKAGFPKT